MGYEECFVRVSVQWGITSPSHKCSFCIALVWIFHCHCQPDWFILQDLVIYVLKPFFFWGGGGIFLVSTCHPIASVFSLHPEKPKLFDWPIQPIFPGTPGSSSIQTGAFALPRGRRPRWEGRSQWCRTSSIAERLSLLEFFPVGWWTRFFMSPVCLKMFEKGFSQTKTVGFWKQHCLDMFCCRDPQIPHGVYWSHWIDWFCFLMIQIYYSAIVLRSSNPGKNIYFHILFDSFVHFWKYNKHKTNTIHGNNKCQNTACVPGSGCICCKNWGNPSKI